VNDAFTGSAASRGAPRGILDFAAPSAIHLSALGTTKTAVKRPPVAEPERPNEEAYKQELAQAQRDLKAAEERMVC